MTTNANLLMSRENHALSSEVYGGSTVEGHPLLNSKSPELWTFTKFSSSDPSNTYVGYLWQEAKQFQLIGAIKHNLSPVGKWRVRIADSLAELSSPSYDSGWVKAAVPFSGYGTLPWGEWDWGEVLSEGYSVFNRNAWMVLPEVVSGRVVQIDFDDPLENANEHVEFAYAWLGDGYQPSLNAQYGARVILTDKVRMTETEAGARQYGTRYVRRGLALSFELPSNELQLNLFGKTMAAGGKAKPLVLLLRPLEPQSFMFEAVYGNLRDVTEAVHSSWNQMTTELAIAEAV